MFSPELRKLAKMLGLFAAPFALVWFTELFILPVDFFTFRVWESVLVMPSKPGEIHTPEATSDPFRLSGPFYPRMHIRKNEVGHLAAGTPGAVRKSVEWWTDRYGYRKRDGGPDPDIVIIGDSFTVGSGITQEDMLSEVLTRLLGREAYPFAPAGINAFLGDERFRLLPPRAVVLALSERQFYSVEKLGGGAGTGDKSVFDTPRWKPLGETLKYNRIIQAALVTANRAMRSNLYEYLMARLWDVKPGEFGRRKRGKNGMIFDIGPGSNGDPTPEAAKRLVSRISEYRKQLEGRGMRFLFMAIPNKESFYYKEALNGKKPRIIGYLNRELRARGVEVIDLWGELDRAHALKGMPIYLADDSHWDAGGANVAAEALATAIRGRGTGRSR